MNEEPSKRGKPVWVRWPAIFALAFIWAVSSALSWALGRGGEGALSIAEWANRHMRNLGVGDE